MRSIIRNAFWWFAAGAKGRGISWKKEECGFGKAFEQYGSF